MPRPYKTQEERERMQAEMRRRQRVKARRQSDGRRLYWLNRREAEIRAGAHECAARSGDGGQPSPVL